MEEEIQGIAFAEDPEGHHWYGTWTARRAGPGGQRP
jgi:hypothetical protein